MNYLTPTFEYKAGDRIADYVVELPVGKGAYGEVYLVNDGACRRLALKILDNEAAGTSREIAGVKALTERFNSIEYFPTIYSTGEFEGHFYYVMKAADNFAKGEDYIPDTLSRRLAVSGPYSGVQVIELAKELLKGLALLHLAGLAHRDIKPSNIVYIDGKPQISDFGLVTASEVPSLVGTPFFMPKESGDRECSLENEQKYDLYALGKVMYCAFTGEDASSYPLLPEKYSLKDFAVVRGIYERACNRNSSRRFNSIAAFDEALEQGRLRLLGIDEAGYGSVRSHLKHAVVVMAVAIIALLCLCSVLYLRNWKSTKDKPVVKEKPPVEVEEQSSRQEEAPAKDKKTRNTNKSPGARGVTPSGNELFE